MYVKCLVMKGWSMRVFLTLSEGSGICMKCLRILKGEVYVCLKEDSGIYRYIV